MPRQYRFGKKPGVTRTYEEMLLDLKRAIERGSCRPKKKNEKKNGKA